MNQPASSAETARPIISSPRLDVDRVRRLTFKRDLERIDADTRSSLRRHAGQDPAAIARRIAELDREWPVERALMAGAGFWVWLGLILGTTVRRRLYAIPAVAGAILLVYAFAGWAPPVLILRRLGFRTRSEIDLERSALKALRGDFTEASAGNPDIEAKVGRAIQAAA
jgi:hypothetical protein